MLKDYNCLRGQPQNYTAAEFDVFKNECAIWIKLMQLGGEWEFFCEPISNADVRAQTCIYDSARQVKFQMNMHTHDNFNWDYKDVQKTASHEVCEVLLYDLERIASLEGISAEQKEAMLIRTRHKVIHHLEKLFYLMDETDTIDSMRKNIITPTEV